MADAAITFAVKKLGDALVNQVSFLRGAEKEARWLQEELQIMQCFLKDEAEVQGNNHGNLRRKWIREVREVAQDAEDAIEIFILKVDAPWKMRALVGKWLCFPVHVSHLNRVGNEIASIKNRLLQIQVRRATYGTGNLETDIASRNQIITTHLGHIHKMKPLESDKSWELFLKTAFRGRSECPQELEGIGRKILEKCHGLPLAIKVAGGLLKSRDESKSGWDRVLNQIINYHLETSEIGKDISAILELSYHDLPSHIKPCFLCLAFFKEDVVFQAKSLIRIWIALGLVQQAGKENVEETARSYLDELYNRNLVHVENISIYDTVRICRVPDLLHALSIKIAKEEIGFETLYNVDDKGSSSSSAVSSESKPRHRVVQGIKKMQIQIDTSDQNKHLRSLFLRVEGPNDNAYFSASSYWKNFELLRILDIEGSRLQRLPSTIRSLIGIRYLRLKEEGELTLPSWLDSLKKLEILDIVDCKSVTFPNVTWKMDSLRHLCIDCPCSNFSKSMKKSSWPNIETLKYMSSDQVSFPIQGSSHLRKLGIQVIGRNGGAEMRALSIKSTMVRVLHLRWIDEWLDEELPIPNSLDNLFKLKLTGNMPRIPSVDKFPQNISHLVLLGLRFQEMISWKNWGSYPTYWASN